MVLYGVIHLATLDVYAINEHGGQRSKHNDFESIWKMCTLQTEQRKIILKLQA
jgi:hypothetical protein